MFEQLGNYPFSSEIPAAVIFATLLLAHRILIIIAAYWGISAEDIKANQVNNSTFSELSEHKFTQ